MYKAILFSYDGAYVTDAEHSESIKKVWDKVNDMGSRWFFYPFVFVVKDDGYSVTKSQRIIDTPDMPILNECRGLSIKHTAQLIKDNAETLESLLN